MSKNISNCRKLVYQKLLYLNKIAKCINFNCHHKLPHLSFVLQRKMPENYEQHQGNDHRVKKDQTKAEKTEQKLTKTRTLLKILLKLPFSNLRRQVVAIHRGHASYLNRLIRRLILLSHLLYLGRYLAVSLSMYFRLRAYISMDLQYRFVYYKRSFHTTYFIHYLMTCCLALFHARLFALVYYRSDRVVWSHLYDLLVKNSTHKDRPLYHYPLLKEKSRQWCARVTVLLEVACSLAILYHYLVAFSFNLQFARLWMWQARKGTALQKAFFFCMQLSYVVYLYHVWAQLALVMLGLYVVCHVYTEQYREVNRELRTVLKLKVDAGTLGKPLQGLDSLALSKAAAAYRAAHARLTAFILRHNESTASRVIAYFLHYLVPSQGYLFVRVYLFREWLQSASFISYTRFSVFLLIVFGLILPVVTFFTARLNSEIALSGPTLASIVARKGALMRRMDTRRRHSVNNWVNNFDAVWSREVIRLSAYYELVWKSEKPLAFTTGPEDAPMDWKYIAEFLFFFTTIVLFFLSKYVTSKDGVRFSLKD